MTFKRIAAKNMHYKLQKSDVNELTLYTLRKLVEKKNLENVMMTRDGNILLSSDKSIQMRNGVKTLQKWLGTKYLPMRMNHFNPLPKAFLQHYFAQGYNADNVLYKKGQQFEEAVINQLVMAKVQSVADKKSNEGNVTISENEDLLLRGDKRIQISNLKVHSWLDTEEVLMRMGELDPLLDDFLHNHFAQGHIIEKIKYRFEEAMIDQLVKVKIERETNKRYNEEIIKNDVYDLVERGTIDMKDIKHTEECKKLYEKLKSRQEINPDLDKEYTITFQHRVNGQLAHDYPPVAVTIEGQPKASGKKNKHYYIYSHKAGFGKSYEMYQFAKQFNAALITSTNNWVDVSQETQFLIFEGLGKNNKLDFDQMRSLTGGYGIMSRNCTNCGSTFKPRQDVQVIITSNRPPYDIYGEWDSNLQRRVMSDYTFSQFQDRFHVIRLDGDLNEDQIKYLHPIALTEEQFKEACTKNFKALAIKKPENRARVLTDKDLMKHHLEAFYSSFKSMYSMWLSRQAETNWLRRSISCMLEELELQPELYGLVRRYFLSHGEFVKGKQLTDKIKQCLSNPDVKDIMKMIVEAVDKKAEKAGFRNKRPLVEDETANPSATKRHVVKNNSSSLLSPSWKAT